MMNSDTFQTCHSERSEESHSSSSPQIWVARICTCLVLVLATLSFTAQAQLPPGTRSADSTVEASPLSQAEDAIAAQHFDEAKPLLLKITAADSKNARAFYDLGYTDESLHDDAGAEAAYRAAIAADPKNFEAHSALGLLLVPRDTTAARAELITAATLEPAVNASAAKAEVARALARIDINIDSAAASQEILAAIKLTSETLKDTLLTAQIAEKMSDLPDAEATYRRALAATPNDPTAAYDFANLLIHEDKLPDAIAVLEPAHVAHPADAPLAAQLARAYMLSGADDKAVPLLEEQHAKHPQDAATTRMLADLYNRTNNVAEADLLYQNLLVKTPDDIGLLTARGDSLIRQKKFGTAQAVLQKADALFLAHPGTLLATDDRVQLTGALAFAASENNEPALVLTALDQRIQYADETPATLFLRATANDHLNHVALARNFYTEFLAAANGKFPNEEWEAKHRLIALKTEK